MPALPTGVQAMRRHGVLTGYRVYVRVSRTRLITKRFGVDASFLEMRQWRETQRVTARDTPTPTLASGTLAEDIERYLQIVAAMPTLAWRQRDLYTWRERFGTRPRDTITAPEVRQQLNAWRARGPVLVYLPRSQTYRTVHRGLSASACNHRRTALLHLYTILDGKGGRNPVRDVPPFDPPAPEPRARELGFLLAAVARIKSPKNRAILGVLLWTGMRGNSELGKMKPEYVDLERGVCHVPSGKGGKTFRHVPLTPEGIAAWQQYDALKLWGTSYDRSQVRLSFRRACRAEMHARTGQKAGDFTSYDLRHSVATAYLRAGADLADVQQMLGHTTQRMTRRYAPFQLDKLQAVGKKLAR